MARNWSKEEELKWMEEEQREIENDSYLEDAYRGALENDPANEWNIDCLLYTSDAADE